jgi:hypothetical protein
LAEYRSAITAHAPQDDSKQYLAPKLLHWIASDKNLRCAWDHLAREGGDAPGPDGLTYADLSDSEIWRLLRMLGKCIREGTYQPGPERQVAIPKATGTGYRTLTLQNVQDRVVARGTLQIIEPLLRPQLSSGELQLPDAAERLNLIAAAEWYACERGLNCAPGARG